MGQSENYLHGKVAIVTGSGRGIGAGITLQLASYSADVVINYFSSSQAAEDVAEQARKRYGVRAIAVRADVSKRADIAQLFQAAKDKFGRVDIVVSNSGIEHFAPLEETTEEEIDKIFTINVKAQYLVAQAASKYLVDGGRLILMSSVSAVLGVKNHAIYAGSKAAITGMVKCLAADFGERRITVNCVAPGGIKTDM